MCMFMKVTLKYFKSPLHQVVMILHLILDVMILKTKAVVEFGFCRLKD